MPDPETYNEKELLARVAEGEEEAFRILFNLYLPLLRPFTIKLSGSEIAAQDIIQNTFIRIWLGRDKLETVSNTRAWIYKIASNECLTWLNKESAFFLRQQKVAAEDTGIEQVSQQLDLKETKRLIQEAINSLPPKRKQIYLLSREAGKKIPEIAGELNLSTNYVKNAIHISLKSIRDHLAKNGHLTSLLTLLFLNHRS